MNATPPRPPQAIPYIRFSSKKQGHGSSHERQQSMVLDWLTQHSEYTLSSLKFEDLGRSGYSGDHLEYGFGKLLAAIESGHIHPGDVVLIEAMDRAGRLPFLEMVPLLNRILSAGISIITLDDGVEYTQASANDQHLFLLVAKIQASNKYSETLSRRIKGSYQKRQIQAKAGLRVKRSFPLWLNKEGQIIEDLAPFIVQAFSDYADGLGERRIYDRIRGKHPLLESINPSTIKRWMSNSTAIGSWGDIQNAHPAVITQELWYRVQQRNNQLTPTAKTAPTKHLLTGLVKCAHCGSNYIYRKLSKSPPVMGCGRRARLGSEELGGCVNKTNIPVQVLDFIRVDSSFPYLAEALAGQELSQNEKDLIVVRGEIDSISTSIAALASAIAAVGFTPEIQDKLSSLTAQREELESKASILERTPAPSKHAHIDLANLELDLLENDFLKLNALLQSANFTLFVNVDKEIAVGIAADLVYLYQGAKAGYYGVTMPLQEGSKKLKILALGEKPTNHHEGYMQENPDEPLLLSLIRLNARRASRIHID